MLMSIHFFFLFFDVHYMDSLIDICFMMSVCINKLKIYFASVCIRSIKIKTTNYLMHNENKISMYYPLNAQI